MTQKNKLGISDETELKKQEEQKAKKAIVELLENGTLHKLKAGTSDSLIKLHKALFKDIYETAGKLRTEDTENLIPAKSIKAELDSLGKMPQETIDEILAKFIKVLSIHPFNFGNGRVARLWLDVITIKSFYQVVNWNQISKDAYNHALLTYNENPSELKELVEASLTSDMEDRENYTKNIDASFAYSGYDTYRTRFLG